MPFGIPSTEEPDYNDIVTGIEANGEDLGRFGRAVAQRMGEANTLNKADLAAVRNKVGRQLAAVRRANEADLANVAGPLTMQLASGYQANAVDLQSLPPAGRGPGVGSPPSLYVPPPPPALPPPSSCVPVQGVTCDGKTPGATGLLYAPPDAGVIAGAHPLHHLDGPPSARGQCSWGTGPIPVNPYFSGSPTAGFILWYAEGRWQLELDTQVIPGVAQELGPWQWDRPNSFHVNLSPDIAVHLGISPSFTVEVTLSDCGTALPPYVPPPPPPPPYVPPPPPPGVCLPPEPPPVVCTPPPVVDLDKGPREGLCLHVPGCLANGIPTPGSQEFCQCLIDMEGEILTITRNIVEWVRGNLTAEALSGAFPEWSHLGSLTNPGGYVYDAIYNTIRSVVLTALPYLKRWADGVGCLYSWLETLTPRGGSPMFIGFMTIRWMLDCLKDIELGTDAFVWAVDRLKLDMGPVDDLLGALLKWAAPLEIPSAEEATEAWLKGQIPESLRDCVWRLNGHSPPVYMAYALSRAERLTSDEILSIAARRGLSDDDTASVLRGHGWQVDWDRDARKELFWELPTIQDHLHWLGRNVDDLDYVQRFGLLDGFSTDAFINSIPEFSQYRSVTDTHGRDFWGRYGPDLTAQGMRPVYAAFHYAAHWIQPSPEQMKEFVYRLRPDAPGTEVSFSLADYDRILAEQDYAPLARKWFIATAFHVPALSYVVGMYRQGIIGDQELKGYHQDLGYNPLDSERFVAVDKVQKAQMRASRFAGWTPSAIAAAFQVGQLTREEVFPKMEALGANLQEALDMMAAARAKADRIVLQKARSRLLLRTIAQVSKALAAGVITADGATDSLVAIGFPRFQAQGIVDAEVATSRTALVTQTVTSIRSQLHDGYVTAATADQMLQALGITEDRRRELAYVWKIQNTAARKRRTAKEIVGDLTEGMMDTAEALMRLTNLGYANADAILYLADASRAIQQRAAKAAAAREKDARTQAAQLEKLARQAEAQRKKLRSELERMAPRSVLQKWLTRGIIDAREFRKRMSALEYDMQDIEAYIESSVTEPTEKNLCTFYVEGSLTDAEFIARARELGYSPDDAARFFKDCAAAKAKAEAKAQAGPVNPPGSGG